MKFITVRFDDSVDITQIPEGTPGVSIVQGNITIGGGVLSSQLVSENPPVPTHSHASQTTATVNTVIGPPVAP